jgi:hypothetical protein
LPKAGKFKYTPVSAACYSTATAAGSINCTSSMYKLNVQKYRCLKQPVRGHNHPYLQAHILSGKILHNLVTLNMLRPISLKPSFEEESLNFILRLVQMKPIWVMFWIKEYGPFTVVSTGVVTGNPLMHQTMDPSTENSLNCCCHKQCATTPLSLSRLNLWAFSTFMRRAKHMQATQHKFWVV